MSLIPTGVLTELPRLTVAAVIDILLVATLIYQFLMMIRGRRAVPVLLGFAILGAVYAITLYAQLELLRTILAAAVPYTAFALIVIFQSELRRVLARIGRSQLFAAGRRLQHLELRQEIVLAVIKLAGSKTGALIVIERAMGLRTFIESGVALDSLVSRDLLLTIFEHGGALHDGAVIIRRERIAAAACFLPLSTNTTLDPSLGTRHRAAVGITEESDCIAVVVSEETGKISVAAFGELQTDLDETSLQQRLAAHERIPDPMRPVLESLNSEAASLASERTVGPAKTL